MLSLQELTPDAERRLAEAGLFAELPFRATLARNGASGTGLAARVPLAPVEVGLRPATFDQVAARADLPGLGPAELVAVHPTAPLARGDGARWVREITDIPAPRPDGTARVVLGDFNATLDHRPLRTLLATGYRDAAAETGDGLVGTWPTDQPPGAALRRDRPRPARRATTGARRPRRAAARHRSRRGRGHPRGSVMRIWLPKGSRTAMSTP